MIFYVFIDDYKREFPFVDYAHALCFFEVVLYEKGFLKAGEGVCDKIPMAFTQFKEQGRLVLQDNIYIERVDVFNEKKT